MTDTPKVDLGIIIIKDNKILMGKRTGAHGKSTWALPGGHVEKFESFKECGIREVKEETGYMVETVQQ